MATTIAAVSMKVPVATSERSEKRLRPQTPCPLVQPLPKRVPNPTSSPAAMAAAGASGTAEL